MFCRWDLHSSDVKVTAAIRKTVVACRVPSTRLKINDSGDFLAIGASDGSVLIFRSRDLLKVSHASKLFFLSTSVSRFAYYKISKFSCHDLPVTGLGFAPTEVARRKGNAAFMCHLPYVLIYLSIYRICCDSFKLLC